MYIYRSVHVRQNCSHINDITSKQNLNDPYSKDVNAVSVVKKPIEFVQSSIVNKTVYSSTSH